MSIRSIVDLASAIAASDTSWAVRPARVNTDRLWSASVCTSRSAGPQAVATPARTSGRRPSEMLITHSSIAGDDTVAVRAVRTGAPALRLLDPGGVAAAVRDDHRPCPGGRGPRIRRPLRLGPRQPGDRRSE